MGDLALLILHAANDEAFVRGYLVPALDESDAAVLALGPAELAHRPLATLEREIEGARAVLVVLSPSFLADPWIRQAEALASTAAVAGRATVVGVELHECRLPLHLEARVPLDFRDPARWDEELAQLTVFLARSTAKPPPEPRQPRAAEATTLATARAAALASIKHRRRARRWGSFAALALLALTLTARCADRDRFDRDRHRRDDRGKRINRLLEAWRIDRELRTWNPHRDQQGAIVDAEPCPPSPGSAGGGQAQPDSLSSLWCRIRADRRPPWERGLDGVRAPRVAPLR